MESESFRARVMALIQKSRRALRLYNSAGTVSNLKLESAAELSASQVQEWREVNSLLLRKLSEAVESPNTKKLIYDVFALRNEFQTIWRTSESELVQSQRELIACAERGDFIRSASLSVNLVSLKARLQAGQAAHHELDMLIRRSKVVRPAAELSEEAATVVSTIAILDEADDRAKEDSHSPVITPRIAVGGSRKVIPLKRL
jgi:hypothetical protein